MKIHELFSTDETYGKKIEEIDKLFFKYPNMKEFDWVIELKNVDDKFNYIHTAPSFRVLFDLILWKVKRKIRKLLPFK